MKRISRLAVGCCCILCFSGALVANEVSDATLPDSTITSSQNIHLNSEEIQYILEECESFAAEDKISPKQRTDYIETCVKELTIAVKKAIKKLKANAESTDSDNNENDTAKDNK